MGGIPSLKLGNLDENKVAGSKPKMGFGLDLSKAKQINEEHLAN
jgi:hypothetical protein